MGTAMGADFQVEQKYKYRYIVHGDSAQRLGSLEKKGRKQGMLSDTVVLNMESKRICFTCLFQPA